jgi:hypothetical protein
VQPGGDEETTVRVCVPLGWHSPQAEYVNELHVGGGEPHAGVQLPFAGQELTTSVTYTTMLTGSYASDQVALPIGMDTAHWAVLLLPDSMQGMHDGAPASAPRVAHAVPVLPLYVTSYVHAGRVSPLPHA